MFSTQSAVIKGFSKLYHEDYMRIIEHRIHSIQALQTAFLKYNKQYIVQIQKLKGDLKTVF